MINKISFKNYRLFKEKQQIDLRPITILIGKNNTGKSAVLKLMTLIESAIKSSDIVPFPKEYYGVNFATNYKDLVYGKFSRALTIELFQNNKRTAAVDQLTVGIAVDSNTDIPIIDTWDLNENLKLQRTGKGTYLNDIDGDEYNCTFGGFFLENSFYKEKPDSSGTTYTQPFNFNTDFISSFRELPKLDYRLKTVTEKSGVNGENLYNFLISDFLTTEKLYFNLISDWIKQRFEGWDLYIDVDNEPYHIELRKDKLSVNITETGIGIGQSLPLITRAFKPCEKKTLIIIEEPEAHLHPSAHAQLAQLFANSVSKDSNKMYLFETHSQNFILRFRRLIAERKFSKDYIKIYYVEFDERRNESNLREIIIDEYGKVNYWPDGIFNETLEETVGIRTAQIDYKDVDRNQT